LFKEGSDREEKLGRQTIDHAEYQEVGAKERSRIKHLVQEGGGGLRSDRGGKPFTRKREQAIKNDNKKDKEKTAKKMSEVRGGNRDDTLTVASLGQEKTKKKQRNAISMYNKAQQERARGQIISHVSPRSPRRKSSRGPQKTLGKTNAEWGRKDQGTWGGGGNAQPSTSHWGDPQGIDKNMRSRVRGGHNSSSHEGERTAQRKERFRRAHIEKIGEDRWEKVDVRKDSPETHSRSGKPK